jgi:hypothetical protein
MLGVDLQSEPKTPKLSSLQGGK